MKKKTKKTDLEGKKPLFLQIGVVISLSLALAAFEWTSTREIKLNLPPTSGAETEFDHIPITKPEDITPPPSPPLVAEIIRIHDNEADDIIENPDIFADIDIGIIPDLLLRSIEESYVDEYIPFMLIEEQPTFMGGDYNKFARWVAQNLVYPSLAQENNIQGRVIVQFVIDEKGNVGNVEVIRGADPVLNQEAVRIISLSPQWSPGMQRDRATKVLFTFPVTFKLQ